MDSSPGATNAPRKRRRPPLACERCRQQKIKCDRELPCNRCVQAQKAPCTYTPDDRLLARRKTARISNSETREMRTESPAPTAPTSSSSTAGPPTSSLSTSRVADPFDMWNQVPASPFPPTMGQPAESTAGARPSQAVQDQEAGQVMSNLRAITDRLQLIEKRLSENSTVHTDPTDSPLNTRGKLSPTGIFSKTRLFGQSNWRNSIDQFEEIIGIYNRAQSDKASEISSLLDSCKKLARMIKIGPQACLSITPDFRALVPLKHVADQLVYEYLRTFEYIYRVLHVPSFQEEYTRYWENPLLASTSFIMKLLLVMSIGSCFHQDTIESDFPRSSALQWIHTAQSWLGASSQKSRINLTGLQIHCLLLLARQIKGIGADLVWISTGSLLCTAMHMGLHRDPSNFPKVSFLHTELRRRLWATVMEIYLQSCMDAGGTPTISTSDSDCRMPSNLDDVSLIDAGNYPNRISPPSLNTFTQSSLQIALARSLPIRLKIAKSINGCGPGLSYEETIRVGAELSSIMRANSLEFTSFQTSSGKPTAFHIQVLDLLVQRFLLGLHHAFSIRSYSNPTYYFSRKISLDCALEILCPLSAQHLAHSQQQQAASFDYIRLVTSGSGLFRNVPLQAAIIIASELIKQLKESPSSFASTTSSRSQRELQSTIEDYAELLGNRIREGETNVKGFVMFSCVLAQINAIQSGVSVEDKIFEASIDSLKVCYERLKVRQEGQQSVALQNEWVGNIQIDEEEGYSNEGFEWQDLMQLSGPNLWDAWLPSSSMQVDSGTFL